MKILIDLTSLADNFSGIERFAACLALELIKDKRNRYILIFKESVHPLFARCVSEVNIETVVLARCSKLIFNQIRLPLAIRKMEADCSLFLAFPVPVMLFKRNMISTIHDICCWDCPETMNHVSALYFKISHRIAMLKCKAIITISEFSGNRIVDKLGFDRKKLWLISCGVDEKFIGYKDSCTAWERVQKAYRLPDKYILSLSTLEPRKNLPLLIRAYSRLVQEDHGDIPLVLAGRKGWKMDNLLVDVPDNVKKNIIFTGFIADEDLPAIYGNAALFVFPSMYEGFGIPPLEALACGTRVLSSDAASLPEVLGEAVTYFESNNEQALYQALKEAVLSEQEPEQIKIGKLRAACFDWNQQAQILLDRLRGLSREQ